MRVGDEAGGELLAATFVHDEKGLRALCRTMLRLKVELVAIERPDGLLVERLLDAGLRVLAMHPKQVAASRARFRAAGGKSDRFDAFVLCELARTDSHRFRVLEPDCDQTKALRALTRTREDLVHARVALSSQLRAELERFWPGPIGLFQQARQPDLARVPGALPEPSRRARPRRSSACGVPRPPALLRWSEARRAARQAQARARGTRRRRGARPRAGRSCSRWSRRSSRWSTRSSSSPSRSRPRCASTPTVQIFLSLFRDPRSVVTAAELLAEIGDCRARYPTRDALAADAGQAAVAVESGKRKTASFRWALQQAAARRVLHARRQHPPLAPLGAGPLRRRPRPRPRAPPRTTHRRTRLVPDRVALLARPRPLRPSPPPRPTATHRGHDPEPVGPPARPRRHPADGRRRRHRHGGPQGRARSA